MLAVPDVPVVLEVEGGAFKRELFVPRELQVFFFFASIGVRVENCRHIRHRAGVPLFIGVSA